MGGPENGNFPLLYVVKLIGVQSNHGVEYFGGPAAPTLRLGGEPVGSTGKH